MRNASRCLVFSDMLRQMPGSSDGAHQRLVGGDRIGHAHVLRRVDAERAHGFFAQEGVVVDLGEALVHEHVAHLVLELALGVGGRHGGRPPAARAGAMES